jgi:transposase, IS5 family
MAEMTASCSWRGKRNDERAQAAARCQPSVQTEIHHPTDSGLLVDSVRVLSRFVQRAKGLVKEQVHNVQQTCRSRLRSARQVAKTLHRQLRRKGEEKRLSRRSSTRNSFRQLSRWYGKVGASRRCWANQLNRGPSSCSPPCEPMLPLVERVITQTRMRVLQGKKVASDRDPYSACLSRTPAPFHGPKGAHSSSLADR